MKNLKINKKTPAKHTPEQVESKILKIFGANRSQTYNYKQLAAKLDMQHEPQRLMIKHILQKLVEKQKITADTATEHSGVPSGSYRLNPAAATATIGKISITQRGYGFVTPDDGSSDILIEEADLNTAMHDDTVEVNILQYRKGKIIGEITQIIQRAQTQFVGIMHITPQAAYLIPDNPKITFDIHIPQTQLNGATHNQKAVAKITQWQTTTGHPEGNIIEILGTIGSSNAEILGIAAEFGFALSFPNEVLQEVDKISEKIPQDEINRRRNFTGIYTFTIDPHDAKDFDDAISFEKLPNQNYQISIHIADVSHYVTPHSALDAEAYQRATSVYLADRVVPMLPEKLSNHICSLRPNEQKCCFSAVFEITPQAQIIHQWFGKTIILSTKRYSYEQAQEILDQPHNTQNPENDTLHILNNIAHTLRNQRFQNGSIGFESQEIKFIFDDDGNVINITQKERKDAHTLIEDYMLLANKQVAQHIASLTQNQPNLMIYRTHDQPDPEKLIQLQKFITKFGYKINTTTPKTISQSLNQLAHDLQNKPESNLIQTLAIRTMAKAIYTTKNTGHYGLGFEYYTHFTSPIRRYPDLLVHRLLQNFLTQPTTHTTLNKGGQGGVSNPQGNTTSPNNAEQGGVTNLETQCKHTSAQERKAAQAERASVKYKQLQMLQPHIGDTFTAIVSGIKDYGFYVELQTNFAEGLIRLRDLTNDYYTYNEEQMTLTAQKSKHTIQLGDTIQVQITNINLQTRQMDLKPIKNFQTYQINK